MSPSDVSSLDFSSRYVLYSALVHSLRSGQTTGIHNADRHHPAYVIGAKQGDPLPGEDWGDSPTQSKQYQLMKALSESLRDCSDFRSEDHVHDWMSYCKMVIAEESP